MKKLCTLFLALALLCSLCGCALSEWLHDKDNVVSLGDGNTFVKWHLACNDNAYSTVRSAYFEFNESTFRYYEDGVLKKEGTHRITYYGAEGFVSPLHLDLQFGKDGSGLSVFDYVDCYTEDARDALCQFTVIREAYHIDAPRSGGVPVRDYHLSDMPYAMGTYVREGAQRRDYQSGKANYLGCAALDGTYLDEAGNLFYFLNNSYAYDPESTSYTVYMRYENRAEGSFVEGTVQLSYYEDFLSGTPHNVALIYVTHGHNEPSPSEDEPLLADFQLMDFNLGEDASFTFLNGSHYADPPACDFDPTHFAGGAYRKAVPTEGAN